jgi:TPR repeat protein
MSVPISDYADANEELAKLGTEQYHTCCGNCGKSICGGCVYSFSKSGNMGKCPFCKADKIGKTDEERVQELMRRIEVNDAGAMYALGSYYQHGQLGLLSDQERAMELWKQAAELGSSQAHHFLGSIYHRGGDLKKAKFHFETAAMAGNEEARCNVAIIECVSGNNERAVKHFKIAASAGQPQAMYNLLVDFDQGVVSRDTIDSTLTAYNNACAEMRSEARDEYINTMRTRLL